MKEIRDIVGAYKAASATGRQVALATVVQVEGSSYRREGARMLIADDGQLTGAISGGCLEGDALRKALLVMAQQKPMLVTYDTAEEDDAKLGLGLGCNGIIHILIEPIDTTADTNPIELLEAVMLHREPSVLVTLFSFDKSAVQWGTCLLQQRNQFLVTNLYLPDLVESLTSAAAGVLGEGQTAVRSYGGQTAMFHVVEPPVALMIFGGGNDAQPLTKLAAVMGWDVTVVDGRPVYGTSVRFPEATRVLVAKPDVALSALSPDNRTAVVLMTHNYHYDLDMLRQFLPMAVVPYIGVLGPKTKLQRMLDELATEGYSYSEEQHDRVYGPTGLDIGAATPEEIALSILAEIQMVMNRKSGQALRERLQPIHA